MTLEIVRVEPEKPSRGKWIVAGGILAGFAYWLFGKHGSGSAKDGDSVPEDKTRLVFRLLDSSLALTSAPLRTMTLDAAIKRVKDGARKDVQLVIPGSTLQKYVDAALAGFKSAEIEVYK